MFNSIGRLAAIVVGFILCNAASAQCFGSLWGLDEVFSNSDGSVQFVMLQSAKGNGVTGSLAGQTLVASDGSTQHSYTFGSDLPDVWAHPVLVATQGFADLNLVKPDFILPNGFVFPRDGTLSLVSGEWCGGPVHYDTLPTDGVRAYFPDAWGDGYAYVGIAQVANNAGQYYQFTTGGLPPLGATIGPGFTGAWYDPAQSGHGIFIEVLPANRLLAAWFAFNPAGTQQAWFMGVATYSGNTATITDVNQTTGGRWIPNFDPNQVASNHWGTMTFTFTDCNHGKVDFDSVLGYGSGSMNLTRLTRPDGLSCP